MGPLYSERLGRFRREMETKGREAFLVGKPENVRWLSGFTGDSSWLLVTNKEQVFFTDSRYTEQAKNQCPGWQIIEGGKGLVAILESYHEEGGFRSLALDQKYLTMEAFQRVNLALGGKADVLADTDPCYALRRIKDDWEIESMLRAGAIADAALAKLVPKIKPGVSEKELALALYCHLCNSGSDGVAFETIVAAGANGALPHAQPSDYRLRKGDLVTIDYGAVVDGYRSDTTRTFILGQADGLQAERYRLVWEAQERALAGVRPGAKTRDVDLLARDFLGEAGYKENFGHGLGHSLGLEIHEEPRFSQIAEDVALEAGMAMTIEPGIYFPGWGGIRIENSVIVTKDSAKSLTGFPKTLEEMTIIW
ncbi:MAG: Xaa-Pro peptidase family protein [Clostridiales bacterium]|nr:Xaa-Pro peptidase family protein [Clostridiales bacterium]